MFYFILLLQNIPKLFDYPELFKSYEGGDNYGTQYTTVRILYSNLWFHNTTQYTILKNLQSNKSVYIFRTALVNWSQYYEPLFPPPISTLHHSPLTKSKLCPCLSKLFNIERLFKFQMNVQDEEAAGRDISALDCNGDVSTEAKTEVRVSSKNPRN